MKTKHTFFAQKKLLFKTIAIIIFLGLGTLTSLKAQDSKATKQKVISAQKQDKEKMKAENQESRTKAKLEAQQNSSLKTKADGTPDKRYKENKKLKTDGTPDKRYKENKNK